MEQKVLEVLQRWHFHPAMRDGVTIASQHIVHFHYPAVDACTLRIPPRDPVQLPDL